MTKSGGAAVVFADLGTTITVDAPASTAGDEKTFTYTLTASNDPSSTASVTVTGALAVIPAPALVSNSLSFTPATITGGTTPSLSLPLPALTSPLASAASVSLTFSGCGSGALTKADGSPIGVGDLGTTITVAASGDDAEAALAAITELVESKFNEEGI